jgi:ferric-dicitrate binding protein FerR (iron transport regulator)
MEKVELEAMRRWIRASPQNRTAFQALEMLWESMAQHSASPNILRLRQEALRRSAAPPKPTLIAAIWSKLLICRAVSQRMLLASVRRSVGRNRAGGPRR